MTSVVDKGVASRVQAEVNYVRNAPTGLMKDLGYGKGYQYAHDAPTGYIPQEYFPEAVKEREYYTPSDFGFEKKIRERLKWWAEQGAGRPDG